MHVRTCTMYKRLCTSIFSETLKGPKHEIFESGFFTQIRPVRVGVLGTGEKKMKFCKLECLFEGFRYEYLIKRTLSMRLTTKKKFKIAPKKKLCEMP